MMKSQWNCAEARIDSTSPEKAIAKYGMTTGCPGCNEIAKQGQNLRKLTYHHSNACRDRAVGLMNADQEYKNMLEKHGYAMEITNVGILTEEEIREKMHQIKRAIMEIEKK